MEKTGNPRRTLAVSDACWERVKLAAIKERVTMREWLERAVYAQLFHEELEATAQAIRQQPPRKPAHHIDEPIASEKHWTPDD